MATPAFAAPQTLLIGDSITFGQVGGQGGPGYAELTADALAPDYDVVNLGQNGSSTRYWLPGTPCFPVCSGTGTLFGDLVAPSLPTEVVTILLGANDALGFLLPEPTEPAVYEANLREFTNALIAGGAKDVILMSPSQFGSGAAPMLEPILESYRAAVLAISSDDPRVHLGPDLFVLLDPLAHFVPEDNVHPNAAGHEAIADSLIQAIISLPEPDGSGLIALTVLVALRSIGSSRAVTRSSACAVRTRAWNRGAPRARVQTAELALQPRAEIGHLAGRS